MNRTTLRRKYPDIDPEVLARCHEPIGDTTRGHLYCASRKAGSDDRFAAICALQRMARGMTDDVALGGLESMGAIADRDLDYAKRLARSAARKGYKVKPTDCYNPFLADSEGDPAAFINHGQGRGHIKRLAEERNMTVHGMVEHESHEPETDPFVPIHRLNPKIIKQRKKQMIRKNPELARMDQKELTASIIDTHAPN